MPKPTEHVLDRVDDFVHGVLPFTDGLKVERHCETCPNCRTALGEARKRLAALKSVPATEPSEEHVQATLAKIDTYERKRRRAIKRFLTVTGAISLAAAAIIGLFHWHYANLSVTPYDLKVFGQTVLLPDAPGSLRVRLVDRTSGKAVQGVPVVIELQGKEADQSVRLARFTTDADGTGRPRFQLPSWKDGDYELRVTARPGSGSEVITRTIKLRRSAQVMLSSDKPVYQPGQEILLRALALRRPDLKPVAGQPATFTVSDPKGNVIFKEKTTTSKFGITSAQCPLAHEIIEGPYDITCAVGDTQSKLTVDVKKYVLPKIKLGVALDRTYYRPGQKVEVTVRANYFHGEPVSEGKVEVRVQTVEEKPILLREYGSPPEPDGSVKYAFELPRLEQFLPKEDAGPARISIQVTVTDAAGEKQTKTVSATVTTRQIQIEVIPEAGALVRGVPNTVYLFASYPDGKPAPRARLEVSNVRKPLITNGLGVTSFEITPTTEEVSWHITAEDRDNARGSCFLRLKCGRDGGDFLVRTDKAVYNGGDTLRLTALGGGREPIFVDFIKDGQTILTDTVAMKQGRGECRLDLAPEWFGTVELIAYRFRPDGMPIRKSRAFYIHPARQLTVRASVDADQYRPGQRANLRLTLTDGQGKPTPGALSLAAVDEAIFSVLDRAPGMEQPFYTVDPRLLGPMYAVFAWSPELPAKILGPERNRFEQALFALTAKAWSVPKLTVRREGEDREIPQTEKARQQDRSVVAFHSISASSYHAKTTQVKQERQAGLRAVRLAWIVLALIGVFLGYATMWWLVRPFYVIGLIHGIGGVLLCLGMLPFIRIGCGKREDSLEERLRSSTERLEAAMAAAGDEEPHLLVKVYPLDNSSSMLRGPGLARFVRETEGISPAVRVRSYLPETLLWRPQIITDDQGRATIPIKLADSITTWRLSASAVSADGRLGAAQKDIRVFQPFFVDLNLPVSLTRGDEVAVPVVLHNYLDKPQKVKLTLKDAPWFKRLEPAGEKEVEIGAKQVRSAAFRIQVTRVGTHTLHVAARGQEGADALERAIEVVPDGRKVEKVWSGTLQRPAAITLSVPENAIEGSARAILKIYPSSFSQLVEGLDSIFQMPSGCFEQTSSTTYPNVLALAYLKQTKKSVPKVEAKARQYIHLGYQRLLGFEVAGGGFSWYGDKPADATLTAYGLMEYEDMARVHEVDSRLIKRTRRWLLDQRREDGSWAADAHGLAGGVEGEAGGDEARLRATAYIAWAVFAGKDAAKEARETRAYLLSHKPEKIADPYVLALVSNALLAIDPEDREIPAYLDRLVSLRQTAPDGKHVFWTQPAHGRTAFYGAGRSGSIETTALAALALTRAKSHPEVSRKALAWLVSQKDAAGTWHSTQATVFALKALLAGTGKPLGADRQRRIELVWNNGEKSTILIPADQAEVMKQIDLSGRLCTKGTSLTISERSNTGAGYQVAFRYHVPAVPERKSEPLSIHLSYDRTKVRVNDMVQVSARASNRMKEAAPMVMLDLPIPAGFEMVPDDLATLVKSKAIAKYQMTSRKVIVYLLSLKPGNSLELRYRLRAVLPAKVAVPPARVYEYYDPDKKGVSSPTQMEVRE
jgi:hypothetical protein